MFRQSTLRRFVVLAAAVLVAPGIAWATPQQEPEPFWADWDAFPPGGTAQPADPADLPSRPSQEPAPPSEPAPAHEPRLRFSFRFQPWSEVLDWFADQGGYSLVLDAPPTGTFNYTDAREYTPAEAIDLLNSVLVTKGYNLVLRDRMLLLVNLEDPIPPSLISEVAVDELEGRGAYELISTRFQLKNLTVEEAEEEIKELLGPQGSIIPLPNAKQLVVTETGGRLRTIRDVLEQAQRLRDPAEHELRWFELHSVTPEEVVSLLRQMFEIPENGNAMPDGSLRFATDPVGLRLLAAGQPDRIAQVARMLETIDRPAFGEQPSAGPQAALQIEVYTPAPANPESALQVMQTLLADTPGVRLALDPRTDNLIALARPAEHATIRATLEQMQRDAQGVEVIRLRTVDPHLAVLAINKLFAEEGGKPPSVDADPARRQLLIRGSTVQIAQIRSLLEKMGESGGSGGALAGGKLRLVPVEGGDAAELLERLQQLWPNLRENDLRVVPVQRGTGSGWIDERTPVPSSRAEQAPAAESLPMRTPAVPTPPPSTATPPAVTPPAPAPPVEPSSPAPPLPGWRPAAEEPAVPSAIQYPGSGGAPPAPSAPVPAPPVESSLPGPSLPDWRPAAEEPAVPSLPEHSAPATTPRAASPPVPAPVAEPSMPAPSLPSRAPAFEPAPPASQPPPGPANPPPLPEPAGSGEAQPAERPERPAIFAIPSSGGLYISSDDTDALDRLETLIEALTGRAAGSEPKLTVFYLRHMQAAPAAERLNELLAGAVSPGGPNGEPADEGAQPSGILGAFGAASGVGRITLAGPVSITPDARLNALLVQAVPADVRLLEQMLTVLDRPGSPEEVAAESRPRLIPVVHTTAAEIAEVVKEVYQDRLVVAAGRMTPQHMMMMQMAQRGQQRGQPGAGIQAMLGRSTEPEVKMSIGVDERTNSVVVAAPEPLFEEVRTLVMTLDEAASKENQTVQVLPLRNSNPETVRAALSTLLGDSVQYGTGTGAARAGTAATRTTTQTRTPVRGTPRPTTTQRGRR